MSKKYVMGIDIGGTNFRMGLVDEDYNMEQFVHHKTKKTFQGDAMGNFTAIVKDYLAANSSYDVALIAIGVPGWVNKDHSYVYSIAKIPGLGDNDLGRIVSEATGIPTYVGNDINALLMKDIVMLGLDPDRNKTILGFYIGTGFGNAIYIDGKLHLGKHGVAAEIGHTSLYGVTDLCNCGRPGHVETRASGWTLSRIRDARYPELDIDEMYPAHPDDPRLLQFAKDCALPVANEITLLDPDHIIIGGGVFRTIGFPFDLFEQEVRDLTLHPYPSEDLEFIYSEDAQSNGVIGNGIIGHDVLKGRA
ncbi:MAG: allose kinase [Mogibacterium sp.]|nr:allose kinase [Mogibacterium sp.]